MAIVKRRYIVRGPSDIELKLELGAVAIPPPSNYTTADVQFDPAVATPAAVDQAMLEQRYVPEPVTTTVLAADPFVGLRSPSGDVWSLNVDNLGLLTTQKVS